MTGTKTAPRSSSTPDISSSAFSPVAYSKMDNIMKYNAIQQRINSLSTIYENLKETTYNMDNTIMNMWKNWVDDNDNKFNTYLINYTLDFHNSRMNERLKRIDNLYNHIYQLERERDLINIEEDYINKKESEEESEEEESKDYTTWHFKSWKKLYNEEKNFWYDPRFKSVYYSINLHLKRDIKLYELEDLEYTYNELMDFYDDIKNVMSNKNIDYTVKTLYKDFVLDAVGFTLFIKYYQECIKDVIVWENLPKIKHKNIKEHIETQINRVDEIYYVINSMKPLYKFRYIGHIKDCHDMNIKNISNYNKHYKL